MAGRRRDKVDAFSGGRSGGNAAESEGNQGCDRRRWYEATSGPGRHGECAVRIRAGECHGSMRGPGGRCHQRKRLSSGSPIRRARAAGQQSTTSGRHSSTA
jgi:hypothetical protein